ncbi:MAG TPA: bifunctional 4-hydroxy-2-oxoglutarate aldolase/2-dehydro-3-deoxy-phosphogluconate aldolase [Algoriphagus sp.]|jgi:2-dehydro-3-deoxyphosphogluconate aldolase/(4S)-4-hydroxy-2-oxoglutarate aldolase|uniref:bifunctional 4-hydroxy-2-oxoglutarate aldolase/2-dehydro-3-deoxy-phosphogluconate aldolase n=1 Tax=unclassified Algoriphagus TaxID=2641541 RepID=UPI000C6BE64B|nr:MULTISPECIES: bifunctional 4-hydroxy-2-oxoglutarate aldolase/2-dehydro-3-deoxy-phosphogluconate aldolase [unclassified Algoriphagus]MAL16045.1 bifunctional 4-hydroxy-2-oxoglutarate aldolase/2-dehydro-3-deoxy-phosphogluconate aldolase [Algoriphagus sp.]MAN85958.1 bifunctional 4-hydroxy-2-oxoglutarate aldolase/2-dehydro-3-deoxy-phosphogluconate aldolase [Algoriphagus sp.]HAS61059.1 bifunctional 4-hydroxy-2-oxoglutarate aldolase/2-dehydro-3-deoxy-phosphogluconate aldolase [Algoriphagus sp.]HCD8|tara:strand:+ start:2638 stop:3300 length:663 start_codon:yes stop_codon:yes gene_type:complete
MRNTESPFIKQINQAGLMPIFYHSSEEVCLSILKVAYDSGIRVIELVNRGSEATKIFPSLRKLANQLPGLSLGIGTIYHPYEAEEFLEMGAEFIVAPVMNPRLGEYCSRNDVPWVPGCGTVTEIWQAQELGAELVKIYPANLLTPEFVPAVHAVLPKIEIIPTGGIEPTLESIKPWFDAGVLCVGMGSQLIRKDWVQSGNYEQLGKAFKQAVNLVEQIKS